MPKKSKKAREVVRVYAMAEATIEAAQADDDKGFDRTMLLRFKTWDLESGRRDVLSPTPWVLMSLELAEQLSVQLAGLVETAQRWKPGEAADMVGPGVVQRGPFEDG